MQTTFNIILENCPITTLHSILLYYGYINSAYKLDVRTRKTICKYIFTILSCAVYAHRISVRYYIYLYIIIILHYNIYARNVIIISTMVAVAAKNIYAGKHQYPVPTGNITRQHIYVVYKWPNKP